MKNLILFLILALTSVTASADFPETEEIQADHLCIEDSGSLLVGIDSASKKIWIGDVSVGTTEGLAATETNVLLARCPGCMRISGKHAGIASFEGTMSKYKLTLTFEGSSEARKLSCQFQKN